MGWVALVLTILNDFDFIVIKREGKMLILMMGGYIIHVIGAILIGLNIAIQIELFILAIIVSSIFVVSHMVLWIIVLWYLTKRPITIRKS